jgi:hypothetical protein
MTKVERKIASRETTSVSVGHGFRSRSSIQRVNRAHVTAQHAEQARC